MRRPSCLEHLFENTGLKVGAACRGKDTQQLPIESLTTAWILYIKRNCKNFLDYEWVSELPVYAHQLEKHSLGLVGNCIRVWVGDSSHFCAAGVFCTQHLAFIEENGHGLARKGCREEPLTRGWAGA